MKKSVKNVFAILLLAFVLLVSAFVLEGCTPKEDPFVDQGEVGTYVATVEGEQISLQLNENAFTLTQGTITLNGKYTFDGSALVITFDGDASGVKVNYETNELTFTYRGTTYKLYRNIQYTISYEGTNIPNVEVVNGSLSLRPADPTKDGYQFIGWYKDSAYTTLFDFDKEVVTKDTKVYARFEKNENTEKEYIVSFVTGVEGVTVDSVLTFNNTLVNLPQLNVSGRKFLGWYVSNYNDASKLSYEFEPNTTVNQDLVLYAVFATEAPTVNVAAGRISWDSKGVNKTYAVNIRMADAMEEDPIASWSGTTTYYNFDWNNVEAGNYVIEVTCGNNKGVAYYANKLLTQVCKIEAEGNKLKWNAVEDATSYSITVQCANAGHKHTDLNLGNVTEYDFSSCLMGETGINFTVKANAEGYLSSESKVYNCFKELAEVTNVTIDNAKQELTWNAVEGAKSYNVTVKDEAGQVYKFNVNETKVDLNSYYGKLEVAVTPVADATYAKTTNADLTKTSLSTPTNIQLQGYEVSWDAVKDASSYVIVVAGKEFTTNTNSYTLKDSDIADVSEFTISVKAIASVESNNSLVSKEVTVNKSNVTMIEFANGIVSWSAVPGVNKYAVKVDNGEVQIVTGANQTACTVESGKHTIYVTVADADGKYNEANFFSYDVNVYALNFDTQGGLELAPYYYVSGDTIDLNKLPEAVFEGYNFLGWYVVEQGSSDNSNKFTATTFDFGKDVTIFADWSGKTYTATLDYDVYGTGDVTSVEVTFGQLFTIPTPTTTENLKAFAGWYADPNAAGEKYTDEFGNALRNWRDYQNVTLYAGWIDVFEFLPINVDEEGNATAYSVKKGAGISFVSQITIPTTYLGLPVTTVEASGFQSCTTLTSVAIPESIRNIETGSAGPNGTGSCFQSCSKLEKVDIYEVSEEELKSFGLTKEDIIYFSIDGVVIKNNKITGEVEIAYFPYYTKGGVYTIPDCVTVIPTAAFKSCSKITQVIIPATVKEIDAEAFASCSALTKVTFLPAEDEANEVELALAEKAFNACSKLASVDLPARLGSFDVTVFTSCSALLSVNVVGSYSNAKYASISGVLTDAEKTKIIYFPKGYEGEYVTPVGITTIAEGAFTSCTKLTKVTISGQVTEIAKEAFKSCSGLTEVVFLGTKDDARLTIREQAFYSCSGLTSIELPENLIKMEKNAFASTSKLVDVKVYAVDEKIDFAPAAFGTTAATPIFYVTDLFISKDVHVFDITGVFGASKLANVTVEEGNDNYTSVEGILYNKEITEVVYYPTERVGEFVLPETIERIGARVFQYKTGLHGITIGKNVTFIGEDAFYQCNQLKYVIFEEGGTAPLTIDIQAFRLCNILTSVELPERLVSIGDSAFYSCTKLETINIPSTVKFIGGSAFYQCNKLQSITLPAGLETLEETTSTTAGDKDARIRIFDYNTVSTGINVEKGNKYYQSIDGILYKKVYNKETGEFESLVLAVCPAGKGGVVELPASISEISAHAFYYNKNIEGIKFPNGVDNEVSVGNYAFYWCEKLTSVELPEGLTALNENAFYYCQALKSITFPSTLKLIGTKSFYYCTALESLEFAETPAGQDPVPLEIADGTSSSDSHGSYYYGAFYKCDKITDIVFPERLVRIGDYAFATSTGLKSVTFPSSLEAIGTRAFAECTSLETINFAKGDSKLQKIGNYAFASSSTIVSALKTVEIPEGITEFGTDVFYYCKNLTSVSLPSTLTNLPNYTFYYCSSLKEILWPNGCNIKDIGQYVFNYSGIETFTVPATVETIANYAFSYAQKLRTLTFEEGENGSNLKSIGTYAFQYTAIEKFIFPYCGVDSTGKSRKITIGTSTACHLFVGCKNLTEVYLSDAVTSINNMFVKCASVKKITVSEKSENFKAHESLPIIMNVAGTTIQFIYGMVEGTNGIFTIPEGVTEISGYAFEGQTAIKEIIIPKTVKTIGTYAFFNCKGLEKVTFAEGSICDSIGTYAFASCENLKEVNFPKTITTIPQYAFVFCRSLESFEFPEWITKIDNYAFANSGLKSVTIPATLTNIGNYAFAYCPELKDVKFEGEDPTFGTYIFYHCEALEKVEMKDTVTSFNMYMFSYCKSLKTFHIPTSVTYLHNNCFSYSGLTEIELPESVTFIGTYAASPTITTAGAVFSNCADLEKVVMKGNVTFITGNCFLNCTNLKEVNIPDTVTMIANTAFQNTGITEITIPSGVKQLGSAATTGKTFADCKDLKKVTFATGSKITSLYGYVFQNCVSLEEIEVPSTVTIFGSYVFDGCSSLRKAAVNGKIATWGSYVFQNCTSLTDVTFANTNTSIGAYCFKGCTALETIKLPTSLTSILYYAFQGCTSIKEISIPKGVTKLSGSSATATISATTASYTFEGCTSLEKVTFEGAVTQLGTYIFANCSSLKEVVFTSANKLTILGNYAFMNCTSLESIDLTKIYASTYTVLGSSTTAGSVFQGCTSLKEVKIPDKVQTIGQSVFQDCTSLTSIVLPTYLTNVGRNAFKGCGIKEFNFGQYVTLAYNPFGNNPDITVTVNSANKNIKAVEGVLIKISGNVVYSVYGANGGDYDLGDAKYQGLTFATTDVRPFEGANIDTLTLPEGMTSIPNYLFDYSNIKTVILPDSLTSIGNYAFDASNIEKLVIGDNDLTIGTYAFRNSTISEIVNSENIVYINNYAFQGTTNLETIKFSDKLTQINYYAFDKSGLVEVEVPGTIGVLGGYSSTTTSKTYGYVFSNTEKLKKVVLGEGITELLDRCFYNSSVEEIVIPSTLTTTGLYEFSGCTNLKSLDLSNVTTLGTYNFQNTTSLESVKLSDDLTNIPTYSFQNSGIKSINLPAALDTLGTYAFSGSAIESITIPAKITLVPNYAFKDCKNLKTVVLEEGVESIGGTKGTAAGTSTTSYTFQGCSALETIVLPSSLESIGGYAFDGCTSIKEIVIGDNVGYVGREAFGQWTADQKIYTTQSLFDVTSSWYQATGYTIYAGYFTTDGAKIVFDYKAN